MDFNTLRYNLQQPYLQSSWQAWLQFIFGQQISIETQAERIVIQKGNAISIERFASITLSDDKNIAVLDIKTTKDIQIARNRVALREIVFKLIDQDKYHGLIVFYHSEDAKQLDYRLSFISSQTSIDEEGNFTTQSTNAKRYSFILGANESCNTATNRLLDLKNRVPKFKAFELQKGISLKNVTDTFSVEALNNEFFKKYKDIHYKRFWEYIANNDAYAAVLLNKEETELAKQQKPIRDFVKKMLGRIVFLHFLQKKGWMGCPADSEAWTGGDKMFMLNLFENCTTKENFYSNILTTLFYETLNKKRKGDVAAKALTPSPLVRVGVRLPFLNGGLFDDDAPQTNTFNFPVEYFKDLFDFFSQYNFTIDENSPEEQEVGIDPEMLGHIFENLLEENKDKGAFYTPKEIVHYMCQESLIQYLRTHLPECTEDESQATKAIEVFIRKDTIGDRADKKNYIVANAKRIEAILDRVKICDPAIGSGAFPMGMLQEIFKAKTTLDLTLDKAQVKKEIIQNSIYGVDIEKGAVDIARLRFWLSLIVDEDEPQPLPNLDYKIMQGNSLLESFEQIDLSNLLKDDGNNEPIVYEHNEQVKMFEDVQQTLMVFDKADKKDLQKLINLYFDFEETKNTKYKTKQEIKQAINTIVEGKLKAHFYLQKNKYEAEKTEVEKGITANKINTTDPKGILDKKTKNLSLVSKKLSDIDYKISHLTDILHKLNKWENEDKERPYFLWHTYFKDVFDKGGFDIVIGNPPYVGQKGHKELFQQILESEFGKKYHQRRMDLFYFFFHIGINNLMKNGILTFITTNYFLTATYADKLRKQIHNETSIISLANFNELKIFETAQGQHNLITILRKGKNENIKSKTFITQKKGFANGTIIQSIVSQNDSETVYNIQTQKSLYETNNLYIRIQANSTHKTLSTGIYSILDKIKEGSESFGYYFNIEQGIVSGADKVSDSIIKEFPHLQLTKGDGIFILTKDEIEKLNLSNSEKLLIKKVYKNSDLKKWAFIPKKELNLIYLKDEGEQIRLGDNLKLHFERFKDILVTKKENCFKNPWLKKIVKPWLERGNYFVLFYPRKKESFEKLKIVNSRRATSNNFAIEDKNYFEQSDIVFSTLKNKYEKLIDIRFYLAVLNSKLIYTWLYYKGKRKGEQLELFQKPLSEIPIKLGEFNIQKYLINLSKLIIDFSIQNKKTIYYENKVDALVFHLYGLSEVEMNQVLDNFKGLDTKDRTQIQNEYKNISNNKFRLEI